jgi:dihydroneopterin aldolase
MSDHIQILGIQGFGYHGVFDQERENGQEFLADVQLFADLSIPSTTDELVDTIDYGTVSTIVVEEITGDPVRLIERLAGRIGDRLLAEFASIDRVEVTVHKPAAPVSQKVTDIAVTVGRHR